MTPTAEQLAILAAIRDTPDNLLIQALAGAAKTTTLTLISNELNPTPMLCLAFNKKIALELQDRLAPSAQAKTINSLGYKALWNFYRLRFNINPGKVGTIVREFFDQLPENEKAEAYDELGDTIKLIQSAKTQGYCPEGLPGLSPLCTRAEFLENYEETLSPVQSDILDVALRENFYQMQKGLIDFDDQIYYPALHKSITFPHFPVVMIDEAQDLSALNHEILRKLMRGGKTRLIAVGDPFQAIYGFRGASHTSMAEMKTMFSMKPYSLTICFRSAQEIVKHARSRAPEMQWRDGAPVGLVTQLDKWDQTVIQPGDAVICRNNAPLFSLARRFLRLGVYVELSSGDVVKTLIRHYKKLGKADTPTTEAIITFGPYSEALRKKHKDNRKINDTIECLLMFLEDSQTIGEAIARAESLMTQTSSIKFMTGHKSKGLEFDRVFFLDHKLIGLDGQEPNLRYVIQTRARETLTYIESENFIELQEAA